MESGIILRILLWGLGTCVSGFLFLALWLRNIGKDIESVKLTMKDYMTREDVDKKLDGIQKSVDEIKDALLGTMDKKGLKTILHEHTEALDKINNEGCNHPCQTPG